MAVKWIGDAAQELGMTPLDAVEILASRQEYPMNGLIDEDRFKTLRLMRGSKRLESSGSQAMPVPQRAASPSTAPIVLPAPPLSGSAGPGARPGRRRGAPPFAPRARDPGAPAGVRPAVGEATSVTAPFQTMPDRGGERTVILSPIDTKE